MTLKTDRLTLRELAVEDWRDARAIDGDPEVTRYQSSDVKDEAESRTYLERSVAQAQAQPRRVYDLAITMGDEDRFLGRVGLGIERAEHRDAQVWYVLRRDLWGKGIVSEAVTTILGFGFDTLGLHRIWGDIDPRNPASARVLEKQGMRREAHLRENWWLSGEWCDSWIYALLEQEWRGRS
ncbi:GNAT family N-acetyltransferase [Pseudenhygromyxa sp. WMMC2535]|nr:GNAT family N-acetyltransferase [Pseudenhygromyxa sp. WMMC2535]